MIWICIFVKVKVKFLLKIINKEVREVIDVVIIRNMVCGISDSVVNVVWNFKEF